MNGHEPRAVEKHLAAAQLARQPVAREVALVDLPAEPSSSTRGTCARRSRCAASTRRRPRARAPPASPPRETRRAPARRGDRRSGRRRPGRRRRRTAARAPSPWTKVARVAWRRASSSMRALWSSATTSPRRCRVRKPVPHATSSVRTGGRPSIVRVSSASSLSQPGRSRPAKPPRPRYQSSYSGARVS